VENNGQQRPGDRCVALGPTPPELPWFWSYRWWRWHGHVAIQEDDATPTERCRWSSDGAQRCSEEGTQSNVSETAIAVHA